MKKIMLAALVAVSLQAFSDECLKNIDILKAEDAVHVMAIGKGDDKREKESLARCIVKARQAELSCQGTKMKKTLRELRQTYVDYGRDK